MVPGATVWVRRGAEATWQSHEWLARGPGGAQGADTRQVAMRPRGSMWTPMWGATWQVGAAIGGHTGIVGPW